MASFPAVFVAVLLVLTLTCLPASLAAVNCPAGPIFAETFPLESGIAGQPDMDTATALISLLNNSQSTVHMAFYYFSLTDGYLDSGGQLGIDVYNAFLAAAKRGVKIRVVVDAVTSDDTQADVLSLIAAGAIEGEFLDFTKLGKSEGVLHTKFAVADGAGVFIGSANMDWMSFAQTKELSLYFPNCPDVAVDLETQFAIYWMVAKNLTIPPSWPANLSPLYNVSRPGKTVMNNSDAAFYFSTSPPFLRPQGWTADEDAIVNGILTANGTVNICMMDYVPAQLYSTPTSYWGEIDNAIRTAQFNSGTKFNILIGYHQSAYPVQWSYLMSLDVLDNVEVRYFIVPPNQYEPHRTRINHGKWFVTDSTFWTSSSNWLGDYFVATAGVSVNIIGNAPVIERAQQIFARDWNNANLTTPLPYPNPHPSH